MERQKITITGTLEQTLAEEVALCGPDRIFILTDDNTRRLCLPQVEAFDCLGGVVPITIKAGDQNKSLEAVAHVWSQLQQAGATRHSLLLNLGGGMVTDLGGFAAATFKRGLHFINMPTTLLAMVDASVGGKTGVNFQGLKNEVGVFRNADCVVISTRFLDTLDRENLLSGYAEMLKHGLISDERHWAEVVGGAWDHLVGQALPSLLQTSIEVKQRVVLADPTERGLRKVLNLGHTVGHALESLALGRRPVLHGYAVAWGLVCELYLSVVKTGFPTDKMRQTVSFIASHYGRPQITCDDYPELLRLMTHDKKNTSGRINFSLLSDIGQPCLDQTATSEEICEALDFLREG